MRLHVLLAQIDARISRVYSLLASGALLEDERFEQEEELDTLYKMRDELIARYEDMRGGME